MRDARLGRHIRMGLLLLAILSPLPAASAQDAAQTAQDVAQRLGLQTQLPLAAPEERELQIALPKLWHLNGDLAQIILYAALAVGIGFALYSLRDQLPAFGSRRLTVQRPDAVAQAAAVERMVETQMEADELAGQGNYAEAMHALLLRGLSEMRRRLQVSFADSLTSREVLRVLDLPQTGKTSLADIIRRVEFVYFGLRPAGSEDYAACRSSYEALTMTMQGKASS
jgi:hypothetical protein